MGRALKDRRRVALLTDNLDKAWERGSDREMQSRIILGLLSAVGRMEKDFRKDDGWRERVNVSLAVFLRADIFDFVRQHAREPDKITTLQVRWDDQELLARLIDDRYVAHRGPDASAEDCGRSSSARKSADGRPGTISCGVHFRVRAISSTCATHAS